MIRKADRALGQGEKRHLLAMQISSELASYFRQKYQPMAVTITPEAVIETLRKVGVNCVLMGTYGLGGYRKPTRATQDVDVLVPKRHVRKAVRALGERFPSLVVKDSAVVTRFIDPTTGEGVIDVMKPTRAVYRVVFRHTHAVGESHRIPTLGMALASKFAAMVSPNRQLDRKLIDAGDFVNIVQNNRREIDLPKLLRLTEQVYPGGGGEVRRLVEDIDAGKIQI